MTPPASSLVLLLLTGTLTADGLSATPPINNRHVLFLSRFSGVNGAPFRSLFHELIDQSCRGGGGSSLGPDEAPRVAYIPTAAFAGALDDPQVLASARAEAAADAERLRSELGLEACEVVELDAYDADPLGLKRRFAAIAPHAIWVGGGNSFYLRHFMRSSGFDSLVQELCGPGPGRKSLLYVGASAGEWCLRCSAVLRCALSLPVCVCSLTPLNGYPILYQTDCRICKCCPGLRCPVGRSVGWSVGGYFN